MTQQQHIAVLMGGLSSERDVSLSSGNAVAEALTTLGYRVSEIDVGRDVAAVLAELAPDVVFNALHGTYGEDGCIQGVLEFLQIPYTHSGVTAAAVAMEKPLAKRVFAQSEIRCAPGKVVTAEEALAEDVLPRPYVLKPTNDGSSVNVFIVRENADTPFSKESFTPGELLLAERYIPGMELSVAVLQDKPLGVIEIRPKEGFYNYANKYTKGMTEYIMPAPVSDTIYTEAMEMAAKAHHALGCRGVSRADIRYDKQGDGQLYMLEVNTHPGMTPLSLVPQIAAHTGITFPDLVDILVKEARCDHR